MHISLIKTAALLAMSDGLPRVSMEYALTAIQYAETWYENLLDMSEMVSNTAHGKVLEEIYNVVMTAPNSTIRHAELFKKFRNRFKPKEFSEYIIALLDSEELEYIQKDGFNTQYLTVKL